MCTVHHAEIIKTMSCILIQYMHFKCTGFEVFMVHVAAESLLYSDYVNYLQHVHTTSGYW